MSCKLGNRNAKQIDVLRNTDTIVLPPEQDDDLLNDWQSLRGSWATFSRDKRHRYDLHRIVSESNSTVVNFLMLNPSTADEVENDPTVSRCIRFAANWRFGKLIVTNIFAYRATDPRELQKVCDPIGRENDLFIETHAQNADLLVCAWGNEGAYMGRSAKVREIIDKVSKPHALEINQSGEPKHPLYIKSVRMPFRWSSSQ